jgi:site-specific DNA-methyltransferase (adenine-specific)
MIDHLTKPPFGVLSGDCLEGMASLADGSVDHIITDPPYSEHVHSKSRRGAIDGRGEQKNRRASISRVRDLGFKALDIDTMRACAEQFSRIARRWVIVFTNAEMIGEWRAALESAGLEAVRVGAWVKEGATPQFTGDRPATGFEAIVIAHPKGRKKWNGGGRHAIWSVPIVLNRNGQTPRLHTTQKPQALMEALVRDFTDKGDTICDPFAGSGTTLVAAKRLGRIGFGWEIQEHYARLANDRLRDTKEQLSMLGESA